VASSSSGLSQHLDIVAATADARDELDAGIFERLPDRSHIVGDGRLTVDFEPLDCGRSDPRGARQI
jgi:hypothetical protein